MSTVASSPTKEKAEIQTNQTTVKGVNITLPLLKTYTYIPVPDLEIRDSSTALVSLLPTDCLVWVYSSRGKKKRTGKAYLKARVLEDDGGKEGDGFEEMKERRVLVKYPKGSTYSARRSLLCPILTPTSDARYIFGSSNGTTSTHWRGNLVDFKCGRTVLVASETDNYRKLCHTHCRRGEGFLEVGCDYGFCIELVGRGMEVEETEARRERDDEEPTVTAATTAPRLLGIDISAESISLASQKFPKIPFFVADALSESGLEFVKEKCVEVLGALPDVIAIDINGIREIEAVVKCLENVMSFEPRLIVVKSREMFKYVDGMGMKWFGC
ncbi:hypothetical protein TrLO_g14123 [Triparma laevis f. longispina]|uniref:Uncharacterized protein n=1 Tax=Triparma laevis f. longispina TaxID=1714387 RepID=A0A9W7F3M7_9STRA|nr:hypothetical protein TrLO_g14123 [Triparma laevis f. longispina]